MWRQRTVEVSDSDSSPLRSQESVIEPEIIREDLQSNVSQSVEDLVEITRSLVKMKLSDDSVVEIPPNDFSDRILENDAKNLNLDISGSSSVIEIPQDELPSPIRKNEPETHNLDNGSTMLDVSLEFNLAKLKEKSTSCEVIDLKTDDSEPEEEWHTALRTPEKKTIKEELDDRVMKGEFDFLLHMYVLAFTVVFFHLIF